MINYEKIKQEHADIFNQLSLPEVTNNREKYQVLTKKFSFLEKILILINNRERVLNEQKNLQAVLADNSEDLEIKEIAKTEIAGLPAKIKSLEEDIEDMLFESNEPEYDVIIEIRAGVGGEESALFAANLLRMYSRYAERNGWAAEVLNANQTELGGYKEVVLSVRGQGVYTHFKFESGVHRVQRVPNTEASGRVHTSTATVAVLVEPKEVELNIRPEDLKIDTYRSGGAGGQSVNKTESAVRITHIPTGIVVSCQDERSQIKNREKGMRVLKARILEKLENEQNSKFSAARKTQVGTGDRSEKIRTYNYSERRVSEHRIGFTIYRLDAVLDGDMDELIKALIKEDRRKIYETKGLT